MWSKIKHIAWIAFDEYAHHIAAFLYFCTAIHEYCMNAFDLSQYIVYGILPIGIFGMFHFQGLKRTEKEVEAIAFFMREHEQNIKKIISKVKELAEDAKEVH